MLYPHVTQSVRVDPAPMAVRGFEDENVKPEIVQRVCGVETRNSSPDDHDVVVGGRFNRRRRP